MINPTDPRITSTHGHDPNGDPSVAPGPVDPETGQHDSYWVLTPEERLKGCVRPLRKTYTHVGVRPKNPTRLLTDEEHVRYDQYFYVAYEAYPPSDSSVVGRFWTEAQLNSGCRSKTTMGQAIAETYAKQPDFYGETFCCSCKAHLPVDEFVWEGTSELVGS